MLLLLWVTTVLLYVGFREDIRAVVVLLCRYLLLALVLLLAEQLIFPETAA